MSESLGSVVVLEDRKKRHLKTYERCQFIDRY